MRSAMIVFWISSVPPAIEIAGTERKISAIVPSSGEPARCPCDQRVHPRRLPRDRAAGQLAQRALGAGRAAGRTGGGCPGGSPPRRVGQLREAGDLLAHHRVGRLALGHRASDDQVRAAGSLWVPLVRFGGGGSLGHRLPPGPPGGAGRSRRGSRGREPALVRQDRQRDRPAAADVADNVACRHQGLVQEHLVERGVPVHLPQRADLDPGLAHRQHEAADAAVLGHIGVGASQQQPEIRGRRAGRPDLLPGHYPLSAVALGARDQPGQVRARARLTEQLAPGDLAGDRRPDEPSRQLLTAMRQQHRRGQGRADSFGRAG
jgi:hypothetical protein